MGLNVLNTILGMIKGSSRWKKASKCKSLIKQLKIRLANLRNRKEAITRQLRGDIAHFLENGQHNVALARVGLLFKEQCKLSAYDQLDTFCDCIYHHLHDISRKSASTLPAEVLEAVSSLIFAASRCGELPELHYLRNLFKQRFGQMFERTNVELLPGTNVNSRLTHNLEPAAEPEEYVKLQLLSEIEKESSNSYKLEEILKKIGKNLWSANEKILYEASKFKDFAKCDESLTGLDCREGQACGFCKGGEGISRSPLSHVHPKLPDYDELVTKFTSLKEKSQRNLNNNNNNQGNRRWKVVEFVDSAYC